MIITQQKKITYIGRYYIGIHTLEGILMLMLLSDRCNIYTINKHILRSSHMFHIHI